MPALPNRRSHSTLRTPRSASRSARRPLFETLENRSLLALVSYWSADNTAVDSVSGNNGTMQSGASYAAGQVGQAFRFDGVNDRVGVADSASLALTHSMTIEAWVKADSVTPSGGPIFFRGDDRGGLDPYSLSLLSNGVLRFEVSNATAASVSTPMPLGQFVHVVGTLDDATGAMKLYLNGGLISQSITTVRPFGDLDPASNPGIGIGNHGGYPSTPHNFPFNGLIDELKVYDNALTSQQVLANFNATRGTLQPTISINDASTTEGDGSSNYLGNLVNTSEGGLDNPYHMIYGPDGNLYVSTLATSSVLRYDSATGAPLPAPGKSGAEFVSPMAGGLNVARSLAFGPNGDLYVVGENSDAVHRFDGVTGEPLGVLVPSGSGGIDQPRGLLFHSDGYLYVTSVGASTTGSGVDSILRYDATSGAPAGLSGQPGDAIFIATGSGGIDNPSQIVFQNGSFYVASTSPSTSNSVLKFAADGSFLSAFVPTGAGGLAGPSDIAFHDEYLYVVSWTNNKVLRYSGSTGAFVDEAVSDNGLVTPLGLLFADDGSLLVTSRDTDEIRRYGQAEAAVFTISLSAPFPSTTSVSYATADGTAAAGSDYTAAVGSVTFAAGEWRKTIAVPTLDDAALEGNENFTVNLSNASGGAIADGQGVGTILDDEAARQISISDATGSEANQIHSRGSFVEGLPGAHFSPLTFGPDGNVYTAVGTGSGYNTIRRYDGTTGDFLGTFIGQGRINGVRDILFRNGYVYVGSEYTDEVLRYDASTGAFVDAFVAAGSGGINGPHGLTFGPDANGDGVGELYVSGRDSQNVVRYNGATGQPLGTYITPGSGGLSWPEGLTFDSNGDFAFVASTGSNRILKFNALTGAYIGIAASTNLSGPKDVKFGLDGLMYVTSGGNDRIVRFTAAGAHVDDYVPAGTAGLDNPSRLAFFGPSNDLYVTSTGNSQIFQFGTQSEAIFTVSLAAATNLPVTASFSTANDTATSDSDFAASAGTVTFAAGATRRFIRVPILDDTTNETTETFAVNLSSPVGGVIADGQGVGTIIDNDPPPTKFYVVDDGSANKTFEYDASGAAIENYGVNSGNSAPRGAASTAAGDKVWVVDANKKVYIYNPAGELMGSWTAGSLPSNATVQGIATNGTDVWIVDDKGNKVYKYAGAASRLSGSQNAASSFNLNSSNGNPSDLVTDGTSIWVLNNTSTDKVFKYTVSGTLQGSWTISSGGGSPTGITLDPSGGTDLWIVDSTSDKVYLLSGARNAANNTSVAATQLFALAPGNTNPQGIADPPAGTTADSSSSTPLTARDSSYDSALLTIIGELDGLLTGNKKRN